MRKGQPNSFLVFDRLGIDPFTDLFEITLVAEGTVRGTGGVRIAGAGCADRRARTCTRPATPRRVS